MANKGFTYIYPFTTDDGNWSLTNATIQNGVLDITANFGYGTRSPDANWFSGASNDFVIEVDWKMDSDVSWGMEFLIFLVDDATSINYSIRGSTIDKYRIYYGGLLKASGDFNPVAGTWYTARIRRVGTTYYFRAHSTLGEISWDYGTARAINYLKLIMDSCTGEFDNLKYSWIKALLEGAISFSGSVNRKLTIKRLLEGDISFIGILTSRKVIKKLLEGTISFIGTLQRKLSLHRLLEGSISFIGTLLGSRLFRKTLEGSISFIGTLSKKSIFKRTLEGKISFIGTLGIRKLWSKLARAVASWTKEDRKILEYLFDFSFDDGNWDLSDATISSGVLDITADEGYGQRTPDANWLSGANDDFTIEIDFKQDSTVNYGAEITLILAGDVKWIYFDIQGSANLMEIWYNGTKASQSFVDDTNWHTMKVRRVGTTYYMSIDSGDEISWDYGTARTLEDIKLSMYGCTGDFDNFKYSPVILWSKQTRAIASWTKEVI